MPSFSLWSVLNEVHGEQEAEEDRHRERVDAEYAQAHDERLSDEEAEKQREEHLACARRARAARLLRTPKAEEEAKHKRDEQIATVGKIAAGVGVVALGTVAVGIGAVVGLCAGVIQGFKAKQ